MPEWIARILEKLNFLTPSFVERNERLTAIYTAVATILYSFHASMLQLKDSNWTGKGLRKLCDELQIFYNKEDLEADIQARVLQKYTIAQTRGTVDRIPEDLSNLLIGEVTLDLTYADKRGWILGFTYPGIDYVFIDAPKLIIVEDEYQPLPGEVVDIIRLKELIKRKIIPIDTEIIRVQVYE
jgi:hypothetical protein